MILCMEGSFGSRKLCVKNIPQVTSSSGNVAGFIAGYNLWNKIHSE